MSISIPFSSHWVQRCVSTNGSSSVLIHDSSCDPECSLISDDTDLHSPFLWSRKQRRFTSPNELRLTICLWFLMMSADPVIDFWYWIKTDQSVCSFIVSNVSMTNHKFERDDAIFLYFCTECSKCLRTKPVCSLQIKFLEVWPLYLLYTRIGRACWVIPH